MDMFKKVVAYFLIIIFLSTTIPHAYSQVGVTTAWLCTWDSPEGCSWSWYNNGTLIYTWVTCGGESVRLPDQESNGQEGCPGGSYWAPVRFY
jgi:hypothetical protein